VESPISVPGGNNLYANELPDLESSVSSFLGLLTTRGLKRMEIYFHYSGGRNPEVKVSAGPSSLKALGENLFHIVLL
jgi:hypothetical protein